MKTPPFMTLPKKYKSASSTIAIIQARGQRGNAFIL